MIEGRENLRFTLEAGKPVWVEGEGFRQDLQGDVASQGGIAGTIDFAHTAHADQSVDPVRPDHRTGCEPWQMVDGAHWDITGL